VEPAQPTPDVAIADATPRSILLVGSSCTLDATTSRWELRADGHASGPPLTSIMVQFRPVGTAPEPDASRATLDASWTLLARVTPEPGDPASAPVHLREDGQRSWTSWDMAGVFVPTDEVSRDYRVVARVSTADPSATNSTERTVHCYGVSAPRSVAILSATCTLVSTEHRKSPASGAEIGWTWEFAINGNATGRPSDSLHVGISPPYSGITWTSAPMTAAWTSGPTVTANSNGASWSAARGTQDPARTDWAITGLRASTWEYESMAVDYRADFPILTQLYQETATGSVTWPK